MNLIDDAVVANQGWPEDRRTQWRIERQLEREIHLLERILARLPPPPKYQPTIGITVASLAP